MGAPLGNQNAAKAKRWMAAVERAMDRRSKVEGQQELDRLADIYLDAIEEMTQSTDKRGPSIAGFADLADRLDGRAAQAITGADGGPLTVEILKIADSPASE